MHCFPEFKHKRNWIQQIVSTQLDVEVTIEFEKNIPQILKNTWCAKKLNYLKLLQLENGRLQSIHYET